MRLFVALDIPAEIRTALASYMEDLRRFAPEARWVKPESLHITLKFIGELAEERLPEMKAALQTVTGKVFRVNFQGTGFFPRNTSPRVFWAGVQAPEALVELAAAIDSAVASLGIAPEKNDYHPHLTLARAGSGKGANHRLKQLARHLESGEAPRFGTMTAQEFFLFRSEMRREGSRYTKLERFPLQKN